MKLIDKIKLKNLYMQRALGVKYINSIDNIKLNNIQELPSDYNQLQQMVQNCILCQFAKYTKNKIFGIGSPNPKVMFIGYSHSKIQEQNMHPFTGKNKELLDNIVTKVLNIDLNDVYFANIFKCHIPLNITVNNYEIHTCKPYIIKQIQILKPKIIISLGENSYNALTDESVSIDKIRGHIINFAYSKMLARYEPSYLIRNPSRKRDALVDFNLAKELL